MQPLFETQSVYTYEEYKRFNLEAMNLKKSLLIVTVEIVLLVLITIIGSTVGRVYGYFFPVAQFLFLFAVAMFVFCLILYFAVLLNIKKTYESNSILQKNPVSTVCFYNEYLTEANASSTTNLAYVDIYKIIETKTNFYIMIAKNQGIFILKQNCTPELITFLQSLKNTVSK